ncbi:MAG: N-formylglutamate amidohydrolase [Amylibacter sp.]
MTTYQPFAIEGDNRPSQTVIICDHATNTVPDFVNNGNLGISTTDMARHIAYDVGALGVSRRLAEHLDAPLIYTNFSRLVIDPNRGEDDPTLVMQLYDGTIIPANRNISEEATILRKERCYSPYHTALEALLSQRKNPIILSIHTFTKQLNGYAERPWHVGVLHSEDERISAPLISLLQKQPDLCVGDNEPYSGHLAGDTMEYHALIPNRIHALIEIRNDLIETSDNQNEWADKLAPIFAEAIKTTQEQEA